MMYECKRNSKVYQVAKLSQIRRSSSKVNRFVRRGTKGLSRVIADNFKMKLGWNIVVKVCAICQLYCSRSQSSTE